MTVAGNIVKCNPLMRLPSGHIDHSKKISYRWGHNARALDPNPFVNVLGKTLAKFPVLGPTRHGPQYPPRPGAVRKIAAPSKSTSVAYQVRLLNTLFYLILLFLW